MPSHSVTMALGLIMNRIRPRQLGACSQSEPCNLLLQNTLNTPFFRLEVFNFLISPMVLTSFRSDALLFFFHLTFASRLPAGASCGDGGGRMWRLDVSVFGGMTNIDDLGVCPLRTDAGNIIISQTLPAASIEPEDCYKIKNATAHIQHQ